jgi:predicted Ser/Thr protein kinase
MLDDIVTRAEADEAFRARVLADLETAIAEAGHEPEPRTVETLRRLIDSQPDA